jgi:hypothetical protein
LGGKTIIEMDENETKMTQQCLGWNDRKTDNQRKENNNAEKEEVEMKNKEGIQLMYD